MLYMRAIYSQRDRLCSDDEVLGLVSHGLIVRAATCIVFLLETTWKDRKREAALCSGAAGSET